MIELIKNGNPKFYGITCEECGAEMKFVEADESFFPLTQCYFIECLCCGEECITRYTDGEDLRTKLFTHDQL